MYIYINQVQTIKYIFVQTNAMTNTARCMTVTKNNTNWSFKQADKTNCNKHIKTKLLHITYKSSFQSIWQNIQNKYCKMHTVS